MFISYDHVLVYLWLSKPLRGKKLLVKAMWWCTGNIALETCQIFRSNFQNLSPPCKQWHRWEVAPNPHSVFFKKRCTIKLTANYMLQTANAKFCSNQILHGRSVAVFWLSNVQKMTIKTWRMYQRQLTRMMDLIPLRLNCINSTLPACAMIPN